MFSRVVAPNISAVGRPSIGGGPVFAAAAAAAANVLVVPVPAAAAAAPAVVLLLRAVVITGSPGALWRCSEPTATASCANGL